MLQPVCFLQEYILNNEGRRWSEQQELQIVGEDITTIHTVFNLKSGARAKLVDRSGSMLIVEVEKHRSDLVEWSEVKDRIASNRRKLYQANFLPRAIPLARS